MDRIYLVYAFLGALSLRLVYGLYLTLTSPLRHIPGPFLARFSRLWYFCLVWGGNAHFKNIELHRKYAKPGEYYAPIVRLGPNMYSIISPDKVVYGIGSKTVKSSWYLGWKHPSPDRWSLFTDSDIKRHAETRRKVQALYAMSSMKGYELYVDECADIFEQRFREVARSGKPIDMAHALQCYAFDVIGDITFSKRFGFLDGFEDIQGTIQKLDAMLPYSTLVGIYHWLHPYLYPLLDKIPGTGAAGRTFIINFVQRRIADRTEQRKVWKKEGRGEDERKDVPEDFLDRLMNLEEDGQSKGITKYHLLMVGSSNINAGSDTTGVSLSSILYHLIKTPEAMRKLRREVDQAAAEGKLDDKRVSFDASQDMRYLQACIKEGLRMHPAAGLPLWRVVPEGGSEICGQFFPAGEEVGINIWVSHYNRDIWGHDADVFRPERWLEAEENGGEKSKLMDTYYMAFGLGSRTCIGRHISHLEMSKLVPRLVHTFDFELEYPDRPLRHENYWFVKQRGFSVRLKLRTPDKEM